MQKLRGAREFPIVQGCHEIPLECCETGPKKRYLTRSKNVLWEKVLRHANFGCQAKHYYTLRSIRLAWQSLDPYRFFWGKLVKKLGTLLQ